MGHHYRTTEVSKIHLYFDIYTHTHTHTPSNNGYEGMTGKLKVWMGGY